MTKFVRGEIRTDGQEIRLSFISDKNARANLQLKYAESRLAEAEIVLNSNANFRTKTAALTELTTQTQSTLDDVKEVAISEKNPELLERLATITTKQTAVIAAAQDSEVQEAATTALKATEEGTKTIAEAQRMLVAAAHESDIAALPGSPVTITGAITKASSTEIVIGKDTIAITPRTEITAGTTSAAKPTIKVGQQVSVTAILEHNVLTAQKIVISTTQTTKPGQVEGATTDNEQETHEELEESIPEEVTPEVNAVQSGFMIEDPTPLYPTY